jgi:hypothetical protein
MGRTRPNRLPNGYDFHHTLFERKLYNSEPLAQQWRQHPAMILPIGIDDHRSLHREVLALPLPSNRLARLALDHLSQVSKSTAHDAFSSVANLFWDKAERLSEGSSLGKEALLFAMNFDEQGKFFRSNMKDKKIIQ